MRSVFVAAAIAASALATNLATPRLHAVTDTAEGIPSNSDLRKLQGRWTAQAGAKRLVNVLLEVQGREVNVLITLPRGIKMHVQGQIRIDETASPRVLDWVKFNGPDDNELPDILGIYKLENDTLTVVNGGLHGGRPSEFKPGEGLLGDVVTFRRFSGESSDKTVKR
jgi:uncharacterized protein (TIGR03067 family)